MQFIMNTLRWSVAHPIPASDLDVLSKVLSWIVKCSVGL